MACLSTLAFPYFFRSVKNWTSSLMRKQQGKTEHHKKASQAAEQKTKMAEAYLWFFISPVI